MLTESLVIAGAIVVLVILTLIGLMSRYRRCASDEILVVFGKTGKKVGVNPSTGKKETTILPSKIIHGGGTFVFPVIQDWKKMSLKPIQIQTEVIGVSSQMIKVKIPVTLTTGIGTTDVLMQNAASRFLTAKPEEISAQITDILIGETRALMATMTIEEINADRIKFLGNAKENIETELNKVGFSIININNADITDDADYIKNLGKKAATKAKAQAEADIAEEEKKGDIQIAETNKEKAIAVAAAEKDQATQVAQTKQEQEVKVAEIEKNKAISLAEADKTKESEVANQQADKEAATAAAQARSAAAVAKSEADALAAQAEAEAEKNIRMAKAEQQQEAETRKATNEREAKVAEYDAEKRKRTAEANKQAGVAEQTATIEVSKAQAEAAKAQAEAVRVEGVSKAEAEVAIAKKNAEAKEAQLNAESIVPAQKKKEAVVIEAEAEKQKKIVEAQAEAEAIKQKALAEAQAIQAKAEAEAEGNKKKLLAEAEGKRASLMAEADKVQAIEMAPALAIEKMIETGMTPEMIVQYKTVDQLKGIAEAQAEVYEHIHLGEVTVYGNENTAGNFMASMAENLNPAFELLKSIPFKKTLNAIAGKEEVKKD